MSWHPADWLLAPRLGHVTHDSPPRHGAAHAMLRYTRSAWDATAWDATARYGTKREKMLRHDTAPLGTTPQFFSSERCELLHGLHGLCLKQYNNRVARCPARCFFVFLFPYHYPRTCCCFVVIPGSFRGCTVYSMTLTVRPPKASEHGAGNQVPPAAGRGITLGQRLCCVPEGSPHVLPTSAAASFTGVVCPMYVAVPPIFCGHK